MQTVTGTAAQDGGGQCTSNFVFTAGRRVFLGQSAHCAGTGAATETDGCRAASLPLGTRVEVQGATRPGVLAYSSWLAMRKARERDRNACAYNDFALVELHPADVRRTNPSVPVLGGPTGLAPGTRPFARVHSYGNSSLRLGLTATSPKDGWSLGDTGGGWTTDVYTATPGHPRRLRLGLPHRGRPGLRHASAPWPSRRCRCRTASRNLSRELAYARRTLPGLALVQGHGAPSAHAL